MSFTPKFTEHQGQKLMHITPEIIEEIKRIAKEAGVTPEEYLAVLFKDQGEPLTPLVYSHKLTI